MRSPSWPKQRIDIMSIIGGLEGSRSSSQGSAGRLLHQAGDLLLVGGRQVAQCIRSRPHGALVEIGLVTEAKRCVSGAEFGRALEEAKDLAVLGPGRHPVPSFRG